MAITDTVASIFETMFPHTVDFPTDYCKYCRMTAQDIMESNSRVCNTRLMAQSQGRKVVFRAAVDTSSWNAYYGSSDPKQAPLRILVPPEQMRARQRPVERSCFDDKEFLDLMQGRILG